MRNTLATLLFAALPLVATPAHAADKYLQGTVKGERFWVETSVTGEISGYNGSTRGRTESETRTHYVFTLDTLGGIRVFESDGGASRLDALLDKGDKITIKLNNHMKQGNGEYSITPNDLVSVNGKKIVLNRNYD